MSRRLPTPEQALRILAEKRSRPVRRPPPAAGRALNAFVKGIESRFGQAPDLLRSRWREIVGEALAARTEPVKLTRPRGGAGATLELKVDGPMATLIQHQASDILARANLILGSGAVAKLRIIQGPVRSPVAAHDPSAAVKARRRNRPPLDAADEARLAEGLAKTPDGPLKAALLKLGREVLRQAPRR